LLEHVPQNRFRKLVLVLVMGVALVSAVRVIQQLAS
jgi:hypothetical protein